MNSALRVMDRQHSGFRKAGYSLCD
jgi:hypothetical protein